MMSHNEEGLVRQMCDAGAVSVAFIVSPAFVPCRLERASKARLAWSVENPGSKANKRRTLCTTNSATTLRKLGCRLEPRCTRILRYCRLARWRLYPRSHQRRPCSRARPCSKKSIEPAYQDSVSTPVANSECTQLKIFQWPSCGYRRVDDGRREIRRIGKVGCGRALRTSCRTLP